MNPEQLFNEEDIVFSYSSDQAVEDGFLLDIKNLNQGWEKGLFSYITFNLMNKGYMERVGNTKEERVNLPNIVDLLNQCNQIVKRKSNGFKDFDTYFYGKIELPSGKKQEVFIAQNETGKFTIMLPEDN